MIRLAEIADLEHVLQITHDTISEIYSHYYAEGVVEFFLRHHSREHVLSDIENGIVWLLEEEGCMVGTVTIKGDAVNRLFVLPGYQSRGFGSRLMDFAEDKIAEQFALVHIDSSLAAKEMYLKRGYREKKTCRIRAENGDILVYDEMEKQVDKYGTENSMMSGELRNHLDKLHTTELGVVRIKRNLSLDTNDVVAWCKDKINLPHAIIVRQGKNWYINIDGVVITVNAHSYTIITAHREKRKE